MQCTVHHYGMNATRASRWTPKRICGLTTPKAAAKAQGNRVKLAIIPSAGAFNLRQPMEGSAHQFLISVLLQRSPRQVFLISVPLQRSPRQVFLISVPLRRSLELIERRAVYLSRATQERADFVVRRLRDRGVAKAVIRVRRCIKESTIDLRAKHAASV